VSDILSIASIVIGVVLAVGGYLVAKKVISNKQKQNVKRGVGIQAGRDVKIND
jgi:hypothetical protein